MSTLPPPDFATIKAVLFDLDGVLFMSNDTHAHAYDMAFQAEDIHDFNHTEISGMRTDEVVRMVLQRNQHDTSDAEVARVTAIKREYAKQLFAKEAPVVEGCNALLTALKTQLSIALCTSASRNTANSFLDHEGNRAFFDFVICGPEVDLSKPHPEIYQRAMEVFHVQPAECIVVEDSINGVKAGRAAGAHVVGIEGTIPPPELRAHGAFEVIRHATLLPQLLGIATR